MKKIIVAFGVVALFAGTTSCKKDWTCTCSDSVIVFHSQLKMKQKKMQNRHVMRQTPFM